MSSNDKRLETMSESLDVVSNEDMTRTSRHHVMNDDIIELIFNELSVKQLLRLESVSNQFMDCVGSALKKKNGLYVSMELMDDNHMYNTLHKEYHSLQSGDISGAVTGHSMADYSLIQNKYKFESILKKCSHIHSLYFSECDINWQTIEVIINRCPQLRRLHLDEINIKSSQELANNSLKQLLSQLNHLTISKGFGYNLYHKIKHILTNLPSLDLIECNEDSFGDNDQIDVNILPQDLHNLTIHDNVSNISMDQLVKRCPHLRELSISFTNLDGDYEDIDGHNQSFVTICNHLKLESFSFKLVNLKTQTFINNIAKLNDLKHLTIDSSVDLNTIDMKPMPTLRSLSLIGIYISSQMLANIHKIFPQLRQLVLNGIDMDDIDHDDDDDDNETNGCIHENLQSISLLPKLKTLSFINCEFTIDCNDLLLFIELSFLRLKSYDNWQQLYDFVVNCIENRVSNKYLRLSLDSDIKETLVKQLNDTNVTIPKWMAIQSNVEEPD